MKLTECINRQQVSFHIVRFLLEIQAPQVIFQENPVWHIYHNKELHKLLSKCEPDQHSKAKNPLQRDLNTAWYPLPEQSQVNVDVRKSHWTVSGYQLSEVKELEHTGDT